MNRKVIVLDGAKPDFREIKKYVLSDFGDIPALVSSGANFQLNSLHTV